MDVTSQLHRQRRRGEELEAALLNAAWDELVEVGFAKLTMESVAARAKTGVAVLYRRWTGKDDLALAAIAHYGNMHPVELPDTGSLRGDMLALLRAVNDTRQSFTVAITAAFAGLLASSGLTPADVRDRILVRRPGYPLGRHPGGGAGGDPERPAGGRPALPACPPARRDRLGPHSCRRAGPAV